MCLYYILRVCAYIMFYYIVCIVYPCVWIKIILFEYICVYVCTEMLLVLVHVQEARRRPYVTSQRDPIPIRRLHPEKYYCEQLHCAHSCSIGILLALREPNQVHGGVRSDCS